MGKLFLTIQIIRKIKKIYRIKKNLKIKRKKLKINKEGGNEQ